MQEQRAVATMLIHEDAELSGDFTQIAFVTLDERLIRVVSEEIGVLAQCLDKLIEVPTNPRSPLHLSILAPRRETSRDTEALKERSSYHPAVGIVRTAEWLLKLPPDEAASKLREGLRTLGASVEDNDGTTFTAESKRNVMKNRWGASWAVGVKAASSGSIATVRVDMNGDKHYDLLDELAQQVEDALDDRELVGAIERLGKVGRTFGRKEIRSAQHMLHGDERVLQLGQGTYGGKQGLVILTGQRLFFFEKSWGAQTVEEFPIKSISSVSVDAKRRGEKLKIHASGNVAEIENMGHGQGDELARQVRKLVEGQSAAPAPTAPVAQAPSDPIEQLKRLAELRDAGVLTDEEFNAKKAELLGQV